MADTMPETMRAAALDRFGGADELAVHTLRVPASGPSQILVRVEAAGVGTWDDDERKGDLVDDMDGEPRFPYVLGSDGAGTVVAVGDDVSDFAPGDRVYAFEFLNPKGGFYAEYAVVDADHASPIPDRLSTEEAGTLAAVALTALRGLDNTLRVKAGESVLIHGASGGVGHIAVQLAKRLGARVLAVASGEDGVRMVRDLGADHVIDGHADDVAAAAAEFAPDGLDAALLAADGKEAVQALKMLRNGGRAAFPNGVEPEPKAPAGVRIDSYDGFPEPGDFARMNALIEADVDGLPPFAVHIARVFPLEQAGAAHALLDGHFLGKIALRIE